MPSSGSLWAITSIDWGTNTVELVYANGNMTYKSANETSGVCPALYLTPNITLEGEGTLDNPYTIVS